MEEITKESGKKKKVIAQKVPDRTLVVVESPAKAHTIGKFMGRKYKVMASNGHVRDLPTSKLGVDVENNFEPQYINLRGRGSIIKEIKAEAKKAQTILLATDPDREGEAISWHIAQVLGIDEASQCRIEFHEITESAVKEALKHPRQIDMGLVNAQQARRILDRLVGYKISPILWRKVRKGLSAGRVQSVAVKMICERDRLIRDFKPVEYWTLTGSFVESVHDQSFTARLERIGKKKAVVASESEAKRIVAAAREYEYHIESVKKGQRRRHAQAPFTTSTMQQEASRKLNLSPANTMRIAQGLYEGVDIPGEGAVGLVTYIRTDSMRVSNEAIDAVRQYIAGRFGKEYLPDKSNVYRNRRSAQDAHEAIRPTSLGRTPQSLQNVLDRNQLRLYEMVFNRFVASQMAPQVSDTVTADVTGGDLTFRCVGSIVRFEGYRIVYTEGLDTGDEEEKDQKLPELKEGTTARLCDVESRQHFTLPPPKYTDASLVKVLEERGIGRPSTYATIISTIIEREYVERNARQLSATDLGFVVNDLLAAHFTDIVDEEFTATMEDTLDEVEVGQDWRRVIEEFYDPFSKTLEKADATIERVELPEEITDIPCEKCGAMLVIKSGRYGKFLACPNYPACKNTKPLMEKTDTICPKCGEGSIVKRKSKKGRLFYGCDRYPACDFVSWDMPLNEKCSACGAYMVEKCGRDRKVHRQCSNPECKHQASSPEQNEDSEA